MLNPAFQSQNQVESMEFNINSDLYPLNNSEFEY